MDLLKEFLSRPQLFFKLLKIVDKEGKLVPLKLNAEQKELLNMFENRKTSKMLVLKPRQIGSSTFWTALLFWMWYTSADQSIYYSMAHTHPASQQMMRIFKCFWDNLPKQLKRKLKVDNATTMQLDDTGATYKVRTAGAKGGQRSFTCNVLHLSEFAFYERADEFMAATLPSLNNGILILESTANYFGDELHKRILNPDGYEYCFFPWSDHAEYAIPVTDFEPTLEELQLICDYGLTYEQLAWRRKQVQELGPHKFKRDFPLSISEAYTDGEGQWLTTDDLQHIAIATPIAVDRVNIFEQPVPRERYIIGVDPALGEGRDNSSLYVVNQRSKVVAASFASNKMKLSEFAELLEWVSVKYNNAKCVVEKNGLGAGIYSARPHLPYYTDDKSQHWTTTAVNKPILLETLRKELSKGCYAQLDEAVLAELRSLKVSNGKIIFPRSRTGHADRVMALAFAVYVTFLNPASFPAQAFFPPKSKPISFKPR
jgi:hypothetical protein